MFDILVHIMACLFSLIAVAFALVITFCIFALLTLAAIKILDWIESELL